MQYAALPAVSEFAIALPSAMPYSGFAELP
jgi:hypothetical protein